MASQEDLKLVEGQSDWSVGMDSSVVPNLVPENGCSMAINTTFRGGRPRTRPGNTQVFLQDNPEIAGGLALFNNGQVTVSGVNLSVGNYFQGATMYINKDDSARNYLVCGVSGYIVKIDVTTGFVTPLNRINNLGVEETSFFRWDATKRVYFAQAEKYLIIQNNVDKPLIFDGEFLWQVGTGPTGSVGKVASIPTGNIMAYGQGRLFVALPDRTKFLAGDLVFGGSASQVDISTSTMSATAGTKTRITCTSTVDFSNGDVVTISGHSSTPDINGTWRVSGVTNVSAIGSFDINHNAAGLARADGSGGFATRANSGADSDLLRFTETTYLAEGGSFQVPSEMGKIRGMIFQPIADTASGQGDLMVFAEAGVVTFGVSAPRSSWKNTPGFQRITLSKIGSICERFLLPVNNDIYFRAADGVRSYRNARAEQDGFGQLPLSSQVQAFTDFDTESLLEAGSAIYFDNRLHFTVGPIVDLKNITLPSNSPIPTRPTAFEGIGTFDFNSMGGAGKDKIATWDGLWTGIRVYQLVSGYIDGVPRAFAFVQNKETYENELWELYPWALYDFTLTSSGDRIQCAVETRAYKFGSEWSLKKLTRGDLWITDFDGTSLVNVYYKPESSSCYQFWHSFTICAENKTCVPFVLNRTPAGDTESIPIPLNTRTVVRATSWVLSFTDPPEYFYLSLTDSVGSLAGGAQAFNRNYLFTGDPTNSVLKNKPPFSHYLSGRLEWATLTPASLRAALLAMGLGSNTTVTKTASVGADLWQITFYNTNNQLSYVEAPDIIPSYAVETANPCGPFKPLDNRPQFRSQLRLPTPPDDCSANSGSLTKISQTFQFRIEWQGSMALSKVLWHADKVIQPSSGSCL